MAAHAKTVSLYLMAAFYVLAGVAHFRSPGWYLKIMPPGLPYPLELVYLSGAIEIGLGLALLVPATRIPAAWGVIALLVAVFPANLYHWQSGGAGMQIPAWVLAARLPFQGVLIAWAWVHTRP